MPDHTHIASLLATARRDVESAYAAAEAAWGSDAVGAALPQGEQLQMRIEVGEALLEEQPQNVAVRTAVATLRAQLRRAQTDRDDVKRCARWRAAYKGYLAALELYGARVKQAREVWRLSEEAIAEAEGAWA